MRTARGCTLRLDLAFRFLPDRTAARMPGVGKMQFGTEITRCTLGVFAVLVHLV